ncbi:ATP-dependent zinc metalloprotease FtsH [Olsenella massiliensis]|uniref:ATP-dependent zinc metalloprotease FtsH n=1 Tax=Olsenella massiliensis TaxID=1622075 RepID=UPI000AA9C44A|nr:ATP-dependent zinc metalloprotease FtsH [Olsenella massiliensis]
MSDTKRDSKFQPGGRGRNADGPSGPPRPGSGGGPSGPGGRKIPLWGIILGIALSLYLVWPAGRMLMDPSATADDLATNDFVVAVKDGRVSDVTYKTDDASLSGSYWKSADDKGDKSKLSGFTSTYVGSDSLQELMAEHPETTFKIVVPDGLLKMVVESLVPTLLILGAFIYFMRQTQAQNGRAMNFGRANKARTNEQTRPKVKFDDVAGVDEAVEELKEVRDFLMDPERYQRMGAKIPRGVLLVGPPGTGKTLLAKAVAGEASVPFFSISGSDFVEMFVGVGASRVRDLFKQAKESSPSIIFIDEIDAVGRQRGAGLGGGHDEREQTLNQLLVEMDGFDENSAVILIAATNRPDILDPALLRPGRFDRQVTVDRPDVKGRQKILTVHAKTKPLDATVKLDRIAKLTPGFTGAELANLMNEAALLAARRRRDKISMAEVEEAMERVIAGPEKKGRVMTEEERRVIAFHESGHALVGHILENSDPVHKISIISRGRALGYTLQLPEEDHFLETRDGMLDQIAVLLGGRTAEELFCDDITTGASNDLERATKLAREMVTRYGMSEELGTQVFGEAQHEVFLGRDYANHNDYAAETAKRIDDEVERIMREAHDRARTVLEARRDQMHTMAQVLLARETVDGDVVDALLNDDWDEYVRQHPEARVEADAPAGATSPGDLAEEAALEASAQAYAQRMMGVKADEPSATSQGQDEGQATSDVPATAKGDGRDAHE